MTRASAAANHPWRQYPNRRRAGTNPPTMRERRVAEIMAECDCGAPGCRSKPATAQEIGELLGLKPANVRNVQALIRKRINEAQRKAGFGDWC